MLRFFISVCLLAGLLAACTQPTASPEIAAVDPTPTRPMAANTPTPAVQPTSPADAFAYQQNQRLGRGVNLGNALEAPVEGEWGMVLQDEYFQLIKEAGFDSIRVPIKWSGHADLEPPYTIDPEFFERIDWVIAQASENELAMVLNIHHYEEIMESPYDHSERLLAIWDQIAERYKNQPDSLYFEILNEPFGTLASTTWNDLAAQAIARIRKTNPTRTIIVGPGNWNAIDWLPNLFLPEADRNLIVTVHCYLPFQFTHQGAEWAEGSEAWMGTTWTATKSQTDSIDFSLAKALRWSQQYSRPIYLGEFGAYSKADMESRSLWTSYVARSAEENGFSWAYWEFGAGFGVYDREARAWVEPIRAALLP
jgi:endoglucanase